VPLAWKEGTLGVQAVASLVPLILKLYPSEPAGEILRSAAGHLRALFETARRRADLPESCRKAAAGSVALYGVIQQLLRIDLSSLSDSPAHGAIALARDRIKGR